VRANEKAEARVSSDISGLSARPDFPVMRRAGRQRECEAPRRRAAREIERQQAQPQRRQRTQVRKWYGKQQSLRKGQRGLYRARAESHGKRAAQVKSGEAQQDICASGDRRAVGKISKSRAVHFACRGAVISSSSPDAAGCV